MLLPLFILAYLASSQAWVIETNVDVIVPGSTENVEVLCKHNTSMKDRLDKGTITRIRIARIDPFGHKTSLAELSTAANKTSKGDEDVLVTWGRDQRQTFLKITWLVATDTTSGAYGCDIHGFDETDEFVNREVPPLMIKEKTLTMDDVKNLIRSETLDMYHKQEEMKASLASLQTLASQEMAAILQEIEDYEAKQRQEIDKLQHNINSTYATKQEVSGRLAELKKFTMTELMSKKNSDDRKREEIFKAITNASTTCERKLSETSSELANIKKSFSNELKSLNENDKKASGKMDATFKELTREINKIDVKYGRIFKNVSEGLEKKLSENVCSCPTAEPRTTSAVTPSRKVIENSVDWPDGKYALVAPPSGCPDPERLTVNGRRLFKPQMYYDNKLLFKDVRDGPLKRLFKIYISTGTTKSELSYCYKDDSSNTRRWPEGNYCINHPTPCPAGFTPGSTMYFNQLAEEKKTYLGSFQVRYCCRSDGRASSPIRLPTEKPFYLYRYKDACQRVEGMRVSDHYVQILVAKNVKIYKVKPTGDHPYTNRYHNPVSLCYYQSSTTNTILTNNKPKDGDDDKGDNKEKRPDHSKDRDDDDDDDSGSEESGSKEKHSKERKYKSGERRSKEKKKHGHSSSGSGERRSKEKKKHGHSSSGSGSSSSSNESR